MNCPDGSSREVYVDDGVAAVMAHQHAEIERLSAEVAAYETAELASQAKLAALAPHGTCACSDDRPGDLCHHHSPQVVALRARVEELEAKTTAALQVLKKRQDEMDGRWSADPYEMVVVRDILSAALAKGGAT